MGVRTSSSRTCIYVQRFSSYLFVGVTLKAAAVRVWTGDVVMAGSSRAREVEWVGWGTPPSALRERMSRTCGGSIANF